MEFRFFKKSIDDKQEYDVIVIGAGIAGLSASIYLGRAGKSTLVLEKNAFPGGAIATTEYVENYPGFEKIEGIKLAELFANHATKFGAKISYNEYVKEIKENYVITDKKTYKAKAILIATGTKPRKLGVEGEDKFFGKGVSVCALCDGMFYKDKTIAVVGGGNTAFQESIYLSNIVKKIYLIHRRDSFRAEKILIDRLKEKNNVEFVLNSVVKSINGNEKVESVTIEKEGKIENIKVDGVFVFIGYQPDDSLYKDLVETKDGYIIVNQNMETSKKSIYAAGDVLYGSKKQAIISAAQGALAAIHIIEYLNSLQ